jgi:hypothetical protein
MSSRRFARRRNRPGTCRLRVEPLEVRCLLSTITYTAPTGDGLNNMLLRLDGSRLELFDNFELVRSHPLSGLDGVVITGAGDEDDWLTVDYSAGYFNLPEGVIFTNDAGAGTDLLIVVATDAANAITLATGVVAADGNVAFFTGVEGLWVGALAGADEVTVSGTDPATVTTVDAGEDAEFDRFTANYAGDFAGVLTSLHFDAVTMHVVGNFDGHWTVTGSGTIDDLDVDGSLGAGGMVMAESITTLMVQGEVAGTVSAGTIGTMEVGSVGVTGLISAGGITALTVLGSMAGTVVVTGLGSLGTMTVGGDFTGSVSVGGLLGTLSVFGATTGSVTAGSIDFITAEAAFAGSPVLEVTQGGVRRELLAARADTGLPAPASVKFAYVYEGNAGGDPRLTVRVTNGSAMSSTDDVRFDLSLVTNTGAEFDLVRVFADGTSGIRNVAVEGDVLTALSPAALLFFGPIGTAGGVRLPLDALGSVAAQDNLTAGTVQVRSLQAVAFGSLTVGGVVLAGEAATHVDAAGVLAPGGTTVRANDTFRVPFGEARRVAFFLDTGPGVFDVKNVLFADQTPDLASVTALVTASAGNIMTVRLEGDGGSIQTSQAIRTSITSTGPLGDLTLSNSYGVADVTAPSLFGSLVTNGPIFGTVQTTAGDLGRALTSGGVITGTTVINTTQGITGRIISRGSLVSRVLSQKELAGVIAAQGDIGVAYVNTAGQLVRFGGILSNGQLRGQIVALGNVLGDIDARNGLAGRVAVKGRVDPRLAPARRGILGNFNISGNLAVGSAIVSGSIIDGVPGGVIGDTVGGTSLNVGAIRGIVAALGDINLGQTGSIAPHTVFEGATGDDAEAINALFTRAEGMSHGFDLMGLDLAGLALILADLAALRVGPGGHLTGPVA